MTNDQKKEAFSMLVDGATYTEVAEKFGVSRQRVNQIFGSVFGESVWEKDKYAGIYGKQDYAVSSHIVTLFQIGCGLRQ